MEKATHEFMSNPYLMTVIKVSLLLYASKIAPDAPSFMIKIFDNIFVKIILIALMCYSTFYDLQFAIIFAIILVLGMNVASGRNILESYTNIEGPADYSKTYKKFGNFTLLDPKNEIYPGCADIKYNDLLEIFKGDNYKLQTSVQQAFYELLNDKYVNMEAKDRLLKVAYYAGLPYNVEINDENAPWIATLLVNYNFIVSETCRAPNK